MKRYERSVCGTVPVMAQSHMHIITRSLFLGEAACQGCLLTGSCMHRNGRQVPDEAHMPTFVYDLCLKAEVQLFSLKRATLL